MDFDNWPEVPPELRPKRLPHSGLISEAWSAELTRRGWEVVDVRLLPNETDHDRAEAVKAWLEGMRLGTIEIGKDAAKSLELEARVYGLLSLNKFGLSDVPMSSVDDEDSLDVVLSYGRDKAFGSSLDEKRALTAAKKPRSKVKVT